MRALSSSVRTNAQVKFPDPASRPRDGTPTSTRCQMVAGHTWWPAEIIARSSLPDGHLAVTESLQMLHDCRPAAASEFRGDGLQTDAAPLGFQRYTRRTHVLKRQPGSAGRPTCFLPCQVPSPVLADGVDLLCVGTCDGEDFVPELALFSQAVLRPLRNG